MVMGLFTPCGRSFVVSARGQVRLILQVGDDVAAGVAFAPADFGDTPLSALFTEQGRPTWVRIEK